MCVLFTLLRLYIETPHFINFVLINLLSYMYTNNTIIVQNTFVNEIVWCIGMLNTDGQAPLLRLTY